MTHKQFIESVEKKELKLAFGEKATHYGIVFFLLFMLVAYIFKQVRDYLNREMYISPSDVFLFIILPLLLCILYYFIQKQKLKFIIIDTSLTFAEVSDIFVDVATERGWELEQHTSNILIAKTPYGSGSWGEQVTLLLYKDQLFLNSICDPEKFSSVVSNGRNKKNQILLLEKLRR